VNRQAEPALHGAPLVAQSKDITVRERGAFPADGFPPGSVRLNFNENPLGPSPQALRAILDNGLAKRNVYVQDGSAWDMPTYLRVSVGLADENEAFLEALAAALLGGPLSVHDQAAATFSLSQRRISSSVETPFRRACSRTSRTRSLSIAK